LVTTRSYDALILNLLLFYFFCLGNKKFGKNNKNRNDQKEENKELDIQSKDGSVSGQIPSSNFGDTESVDEKVGEDAGSKRRRKGMIEKNDFGGKNQNRYSSIKKITE